MDTNQIKEQLVYVLEEVEKQSALVGRNFKFTLNKGLIDYFGNREEAFKKTKIALSIIEEKLGILNVKNSYYVDLEYDEIDKYDRAWFQISLTDEFYDSASGNTKTDKPLFNARTGILHLDNHTVDFEPKTRKAVILSLCFHRPKTGVGFERISSEYAKIDPTVTLSDKQIRDDVQYINQKITNVLPNVTEFLSAKKGYVRIV